MADYPHLSDWQGWRAKQKYTNLDPFERPIPAPVAGIFDNTGGDLRTVCFNPAWSPILTGALSRLTVPELYLSGGEDAVQDVLKLMNNVAGIGDNPCLPQSIESTECAYFPSWYAGIEYLPYNPFTGGDLPANYAIAPFFRFTQIDTWFPDWIDDIFSGIIENTTGYLENDIFVSFLSLPTYQNPFDGLDYPTIKLTVQGTGILRLKFLLVPFGGRALISFDPVGIFDILQATWSTEDRIIELNRDILALVPETDVDAIEEIILDEDTTHEIYITFLPTINDEAPIFQYGGGFRGYELCGNLTVIDPTSGLPIDFQNQQSGIYQEGIIVATYEDILKALNDHRTIDSTSWLLAQQEGNIQAGVTIDAGVASGGVSVGSGVQLSGGGTLLTPTVSASNEEARSGGVYRQAVGIANLLSEAEALKVGGFTASQIINVSRLVINPFDLTAWSSVITDYFNSADDIVIDIDALAEHLYCSTIGVAIVQYATEIVSSNPRHTASETDFLVRFISEIPTTTFSDWFNEGASSPRDDYLSYGCYLIPQYDIEPDISVLDDASAPYWTLPVDSLNLKPINNRWKIDFSGQWTHSDGRVMDGFYYQVNAGDAFTSLESELAVRTQAFTGQEHPVDNYPDYNATHNYSVFFSHATNQTFIRGISFPVKPANSTGWTGTITMTVTDLGVS